MQKSDFKSISSFIVPLRWRSFRGAPFFKFVFPVVRGSSDRSNSFFKFIFPLVICLAGRAGTNIIKDRLPPPGQTEKGVLFHLDTPSARTVTVAGEFNGWEHRPDQARTVHLKKGSDGIWRATVNIPPGRYQYKFVLDYQTWILDPYNPNTFDDGTGNLNSLLIVR